jgi:hypothetical protein
MFDKVKVTIYIVKVLFSLILSQFLHLLGKNGVKISGFLHNYHGFTSVVTNILPRWGLIRIVTIQVHINERFWVCKK